MTYQLWSADDRQHENLFHRTCRTCRRPDHLHYYLLAGLAAGAAAFSSLTGVLLEGVAGFAVGTVAVTAGLASAFFSSFLAGSAAKAETANAVAIRVAINCFMVISLI